MARTETHADWLPKTSAERDYVATLKRAGKAATPAEKHRIVREELKPLRAMYGGTVANVRGDILAISVKKGWV